MFTQLIDPLDNLTLTCLVALVPVVSLLVMLAVFRVPAWLATLIGSLITFALAAWVWKMPLDNGGHAYLYGAATGVWNVDWITLWGMVLFNTMSVSGLFENFRSEEHTSELQSQSNLVCRLLLEKKKKNNYQSTNSRHGESIS